MLFLRDSRRFFARLHDANGEANFDFIRNYKLNTSAKNFCKGKKTSMFASLLQEAYSYTFEQEPNYVKLRFMIRSMLFQIKFVPNNVYSWILSTG